MDYRNWYFKLQAKRMRTLNLKISHFSDFSWQTMSLMVKGL